MAFVLVGTADLALGVTPAALGAQTNDLILLGAVYTSTPSLSGWQNLTSYFDGTYHHVVGMRRYDSTHPVGSPIGGLCVILRGGNGTPQVTAGANDEHDAFAIAPGDYAVAVGIGVSTTSFAQSDTPFTAYTRAFAPTSTAFSDFAPGAIIVVPFAAEAPTLSGAVASAAATVTPGSLLVPTLISGDPATASASVTSGSLTTPGGPITITGDVPSAAAIVPEPPPVYEFVPSTHLQDVGTRDANFVLSVQVLVGSPAVAAATVNPGEFSGPIFISDSPTNASAAAAVTPGSLNLGIPPAPTISGTPAAGGTTVAPGALSVPNGPISMSGDPATASTTVAPGTLTRPEPAILTADVAQAVATVVPGSLAVRPLAPTISVVLLGSAQVQISWEGVANATSYRVERRVSGGSFVPIATVPA